MTRRPLADHPVDAPPLSGARTSEVLMVVAIIIFIAAIAVPGRPRARMTGSETSAMRTSGCP